MNNLGDVFMCVKSSLLSWLLKDCELWNNFLAMIKFLDLIRFIASNLYENYEILKLFGVEIMINNDKNNGVIDSMTK